MEDNLLAPCGIYCGICPIYIADKGNHIRLKEILATEFEISASEVKCDGCFSPAPFVLCQTCTVRNCIVAKKAKGCFQCNDFPCQTIEDIPDITAKKAILRSVPVLRELGPERFKEEQLKHFRCPSCGYQLFMGARRCHNCGNATDLD